VSTTVAVLVPVVGRPHNAAPFMESFYASGAQSQGAVVYAICEHDDPESQRAWEAAGAKVLAKHFWRTFAEKINFGYKITKQDWIYMVGDDVRFHPGWLEAALSIPGGPKVVGTRDAEAPEPNGKAGHLLIERDYIDRYGASWDGPGVVCHTYSHYYVDDEILSAAYRRGVYAYCSDSFVEHLHPNNGKAPQDAIYWRGWNKARDDWIEWLNRRAMHDEAVNVEER
jgi:glycosyltransferase involved in cell wall biosynthesis